MQHTKLLLFGFCLMMFAACSEHGHSHNGKAPNDTPSQHDSIN